MPSTPIPPGYAHVLHSLSLVGDPQPMAITYGVSLLEGADTQLLATITALHGFVGTHLMPKISSKYTLTRSVIRAGQQGLTPDLVAEFNGTTAGASGSSPLPQNSAILIKKVSGLTGRRNRGRFNLPGIDETSVNEIGVLAAATLTSIQTGANNFLSAVAGQSNVGEMVILHQDVGDVPGQLPTTVFQLVVDPVISTQRRRLRR